MNHPVIALDAASGRSYGSLIMPDGTTLVGESEGSRAHSQTLMPMLEELLARAGISWRDLQMLALGIGPGSFTGLRIAAAAMAGINASLQLPVLPVSSLAITAIQADYEGPLYVLEDARAGEVFSGRYHGAAAMQDDACLRWDELAAVEPGPYTSAALPPVELTGWQRFEPALHRGEAMAMVVGEALRQPLKELPKYVQPSYLQISQAEKNRAAMEKS